MLDEFVLEQLVLPLQEWFSGNARILPWREEPTPYYVWISEIMLQQTRVEAVKPYFERFIQALPDVEALAVCPEDKLLKLWEGLGYYNRVRNLNTAAKQIMEEYGGVIPDEYETLLKLKGIGHYTAGAIASIAYGKPVPAVDGNVLRVLSRVTADDSDIMKQSVRTHMEERLRELMEQDARLVPSAFNQALMELGAMVCVPNGEPHCDACPWHALCAARKTDRIAELPVKKKAKERRIEKKTVLVIRDGERVALGKRPAKGLLAGLYELPNVPGHLDTEETLAFLKAQGFWPIRIQPLPAAKHIFSHVEWHMIGYMVLVSEMDMRPTLQDGIRETVMQYSEEIADGKETGNWFMAEACDVIEHYAIPTAFSRYAAYMNIPLGKQ
jgi:A/G-specific adenine glycosylase